MLLRSSSNVGAEFGVFAIVVCTLIAYKKKHNNKEEGPINILSHDVRILSTTDYTAS